MRRFALTFLAGCLLTGMAAWAAETPDRPAAEPLSAASVGPHVKKLNLVIRDGVFTNAGGQKQEATVQNLADFARARYHQNIVLSPGAGSVVISDLKLDAADIDGFFQALTVASGGTISAGKAEFGETGLWAVTARDRAPRKVEVFNLTGYLHSGSPGGKDTGEKLEQLQTIILQTLHQLKLGRLGPGEEPSFQFHDGANLFVVIGTDEAVDVARKVIGALPVPRGGFVQRPQDFNRQEREPTPIPPSPVPQDTPGPPKP